MKNLILTFILSLGIFGSINANTIDKPISNDLEIVSNSDIIDAELIEMIKTGKIDSLTITYNDFDCTLSATVSYNGASITLSITAEDCYKAGAGLKQAVKGFMNEE